MRSAPITVQLGPRLRSWSTPRWRWSGPALLAAACLAGALVLMSPLLPDLGARSLGLWSDGVQKAWFISWFAYAATHGQNPLVTTFLSPHQTPIDLMRNNSVPFWGLLLMPLTLKGGGVLSANVAALLSLAANPMAAILVWRRYVSWGPAAWVAGFAFGFCPFVVAQANLGHLTWLTLWPLPLTLLLIDELFIRQRANPVQLGLGLGGLAGCMILLNQELLATTAVVAVFMLAVAAVRHPAEVRPRLAFALRGVGAAVPVGLIIAGLPLAVEFAGAGHTVRGANASSLLYSVDLAGLAVPGPGQLLAPAWAVATYDRFSVPFGDTVGYLGLPLLAVVMVTFNRFRHRPWVPWASGLTAVGIILALGPQLHIIGGVYPLPLPWMLLEHLPLLALALPSRAIVFAYFGAFFCLALLLDGLHQQSGVRPLLASALAAVAVVVTLLPSGGLSWQKAATPSAVASPRLLGVTPGSEVAVLPIPNSANGAQAMLWQAESGFYFRMPWGYVIRAGPGRTAELNPTPTQLTTALESAAMGAPPPTSLGPKVLAELRALGVKAVVVGPSPGARAMTSWLTGAFGRAPSWHGRVAIWRVHRAAGNSVS